MTSVVGCSLLSSIRIFAYNIIRPEWVVWWKFQLRFDRIVIVYTNHRLSLRWSRFTFIVQMARGYIIDLHMSSLLIVSDWILYRLVPTKTAIAHDFRNERNGSGSTGSIGAAIDGYWFPSASMQMLTNLLFVWYIYGISTWSTRSSWLRKSS